MSQRIVAIHGCYNTLNFGDLLLLDLVAQHVAKRPGFRAVCLSPPDARAEIAAERGSPLRTALAADCAVFGGGGYLGGTGDLANQWRLARYSAPALAWRLRRTPYVIVGVGYGRRMAWGSARQMQLLCGGASRVCPRDEATSDALRGCGVDPAKIETTADLVMGMTRADLPAEVLQRARALIGPRRAGVRRVALHLQFGRDRADLLRSIVGVVAEALRGRDGIEPIWIADHDDSYFELVRQFGGADIPGARFLGRQHHWTTAALVGEFDAVFTTKLHVGITAWALGVPPCGYSVHAKSRRFYAAIGRSDFQADAGADPAALGAWLRTFVERPEEFAREDADARRALPAKARRNLEVVDELLDRVDARR